MPQSIVIESQSVIEDVRLTQVEAELQQSVADMAWPTDREEQYKIMWIVSGMMESHGISQRRAGVVIGWPQRTLSDRLERFRRSEGVLESGSAHSEGWNALRMRVQRGLEKARSEGVSDSTTSPWTPSQFPRHAGT